MLSAPTGLVVDEFVVRLVRGGQPNCVVAELQISGDQRVAGLRIRWDRWCGPDPVRTWDRSSSLWSLRHNDEDGFHIPTYTALTEADQEFIIGQIRAFYED
jgi:hypothetical protein